MTVDTVALEKGLNAAFKKAQDELNGSGYRQDMRGLIMEVPSTGSSERYGWFGDVPAVQEWIGDETSGDLQDYEYEIKNRDFYTAIGIDRNEIADDRAGILLPQIQSMVQAIADHKLDLVADLILNGITGLAFDGVPVQPSAGPVGFPATPKAALEGLESVPGRLAPAGFADLCKNGFPEPRIPFRLRKSLSGAFTFLFRTVFLDIPGDCSTIQKEEAERCISGISSWNSMKKKKRRSMDVRP